MASTHVSLVTAGGTANRRIASSLYGYCQTAASTVAKTVSLYTGNSTTTDGSWDAGDLFHGLTITVRFRYSNTATNPTLNVNSTGAKRIYKYGTTSPGKTAATSWQANSVISLTYDTLLNSSGCWVMNDHLDDTTGGSGSIEYTLSGSGDDDEYTITATPTTGTPTSATIPAANTTDAGVMTASDKTKLNGIASGAEVNVQSDWAESDTTADSYIKNKPTIPPAPNVNDVQVNGTSVLNSGIANIQDSDFISSSTITKLVSVFGGSTFDEALSALADEATLHQSTLSLTSGWSQSVNWVRKKYGIVEMFIAISGGSISGSGWIQVATLPDGYRPTLTYIDMVNLDNTRSADCCIKIETNGHISVYKTSTLSNNLRLHAVFNAW